MQSSPCRPILSAVLAIVLQGFSPSEACATKYFYINDLGDLPAVNPGSGSGGTANGTVTLRSAIMESQFWWEPSNIRLHPDLEALPGNVITLESNLPPIHNRVLVLGPGVDRLTIRGAGHVFYACGNELLYITGVTMTSATNSALLVEDTGTLWLAECIVRSNSSTTNGGAVRLVGTGPTLTVDRCFFESNTATMNGGAICDSEASNATMTLYHSSFARNTSGGSGGAIMTSGNNSLKMINCTLSWNVSGADGGALFSSPSSTSKSDTIIACTIAINNAVNAGGISFVPSNGQFVLYNSVIANNWASSWLGPDILGDLPGTNGHNFVSRGDNMTGMQDGVQGNKVGSLGSPKDPRLGPLENNGGMGHTHQPFVDSPLLRAATLEIPEVTDNNIGADARGMRRGVGGAPDMGAVELVLVNSLLDEYDSKIGAGEFTLREAIQMTFPNVPILFDPALFTGGPQEIVLNSALPLLNRGRRLDGPGADLLTLRATSGRILNLSSCPEATFIMNLSMTGATDGAINLKKSSLILTRCNLFDNEAYSDGAVLSEGGAVDLDDGSYLMLDTCIIGPNNRASKGGGIDAMGGATNYLVARNSLFVGNWAFDLGGALALGSGSSTRLFNCTLVDNSARLTGGAIWQIESDSYLLLCNSTITGNSALGSGGGLSQDFLGVASPAFLINTVIAENSAPDAPDFLGFASASSRHSLVGDGSGMSGITHGVNGNLFGASGSPISPQLAALADNGGYAPTRLPLPGSIVIDTGTTTIPPENAGWVGPQDARGKPRLVGAAVDMGAVEVQPPDMAVPGDINGDQVVTVADVTALGNYVTGRLATISGDGDINNDGSTNHLDVHALAVGIANGTY